MTEKNKPKTLSEMWALDGLPNVEEPTEETLAYVAWFREEEKKKKEFMFEMETLRFKKPFKYKQHPNGDKEIFFGENASYKANLSKEQYTKIIDTFKGRTVQIGAIRTNPPKGSLGEWLKNNGKKQGITSYIVPILIKEGYATPNMPINSGKIKFYNK